MWARACSTAVRCRSTARPGPVCCSFRNLPCRASSSAMDTARPRPDLAAGADHVVNDGTVHVGAVNVKLDQAQPLTPDVLGDRCGAFFFGPIRRRDRAGDNDGKVEVACDVLLVAVEPLRAALAAVA